jgi:hypothetical protein
VEGTPLTAEQRPLFFKHANRVPKGDLSDSAHQQLVEFEETRAKNHEVESSTALRKNVNVLYANGLLDDWSHDWWTEFLDKQDNTVWSETAGAWSDQFTHVPHALLVRDA